MDENPDAHLNFDIILFMLRVKKLKIQIRWKFPSGRLVSAIYLSLSIRNTKYRFTLSTSEWCETEYLLLFLLHVCGKKEIIHFLLCLLSLIIIPELPHSPPTLWTEFTKYDPGDILRANCSTQPSKPSSTITFQLNQNVVSKTFILLELFDGRGGGWGLT